MLLVASLSMISHVTQLTWPSTAGFIISSVLKHILPFHFSLTLTLLALPPPPSPRILQEHPLPGARWQAYTSGLLKAKALRLEAMGHLLDRRQVFNSFYLVLTVLAGSAPPQAHVAAPYRPSLMFLNCCWTHLAT